MSDILPTPPEPRTLPFRRPADYYSAPVSEVRPIVHRGVAYGCGAASIVAIVILFIGGAIAGSGQGGALFATLFGTMAGEIRGMYAKDVTAAQKAAFDAEIKALQKNLDDGKVSISELQPLLRSIRESSGDSSVTGKELDALTQAARNVNHGVSGSRGSGVSGSHPAQTSRPRNPETPR